MHDILIIARLVAINDRLIELLKWSIENDKPDFALKLEPIPKALASVLEEMAKKHLESLNVPEKRNSSRKSLKSSANDGNFN